jgi:hypothetical protein
MPCARHCSCPARISGTVLDAAPRLRLIAHAAGTVKAHVDREEVVSGRINAVLDVTNPEPLPDDDLLLTLPNVTVTPHIAGSVGNELPAMAELAASEVERLAAGVPCWLPGQPR